MDGTNDISQANDHGEDSFHLNRSLTAIALGGAVISAGVIFAPTVLPLLGIGDVDMARESMSILHTPSGALDSGIAGDLNKLLFHVPVIGESLAQGGILNAVTTGITGIGGVVLGNYVKHHAQSPGTVRMGSMIKFAALATSALIALPTILTGLSAGIIFLSTLVGDVETTINTIGVVDKTLGAAGGNAPEFVGFTGSGIAAALPHFFTCGMSIVPATVSMAMATQSDAPPPKTAVERLAQSRNQSLASGLGL